MLKRNLLALTIFLLTATSAKGQVCRPRGGTGDTLDINAATKGAVVDSVSRVIREMYVFPDQASQVIELIKGKLDRGQYDEIVKADDYTRTLMEDLRVVSDDLHFALSIRPRDSDKQVSSCASPCTSPAKVKQANYGFKTVKHLAGNIGYLELTIFADADKGRSMAEASMQLLSGVDALIIDLRSSMGGHHAMIPLMASFLLEPNTELHRLYRGAMGTTVHIRTRKPANVKPRPDLPLYILTSSMTASSAEALAYDLKHLGRATIVGEKTVGTGHCAEMMSFEFPEFTLEMRLPVYNPIHPVTQSNWEGIGVVPDIAVSTDDALAEAHQQALRHLAASVSDPGQSWALEWASLAIRREYQPLDLTSGQLIEYTGSYGPRRVMVKDGTLIYEHEGNPAAYKLVPLDTDVFALADLDIMRLRFDRDETGAITALTGLYDIGRQDTHPRQ